MWTFPPAMLSDAFDGPVDPVFSTVVQLTHFDGANGSTTFTNSCSKGATITAGSASTISTTQSVFGGASFRKAAGTTSECITHADYRFESEDFTIEFRFRADAVQLANILDMRDSTPNVRCATIYTLANGTLNYFVANADRITSASGVITATTWYAIAVSRVSGTTRMFVDGTQVGSSWSDATDYDNTARVAIPSHIGALATNFYMDELRISNGVYGAGAGRYSGNYTIATEAFPDQ